MDRYDVVVVDAGLAGLSLARHLQQVGAEVLVVEARERVGGRTLSVPSAGAIFEHGAQWIHPGQERIRQLVQQLGLETIQQSHHGTKVVDIDGDRSTYQGQLPSRSLLGMLRTELGLRRLDAMAERVPLDAPASAHLAVEWDSWSLETFGRDIFRNRDCKKLFDVAVRVLMGAEPAELSLLYFLFCLNSAGGFRKLSRLPGGAPKERLLAGVQTLSQRLAEQLGDGAVLLGAPVHAIQQGVEQVTVCSDAGEHVGRYVVVALPPHLAGRLRYEPSLPPLRDQLLQRWAMGATTKVLAFYPEPSWRDHGMSGDAMSSGPISYVFDNTTGGQASLAGVVAGKHARRWTALSAAERRETALAELERLVGAPASSAVRYAERDWTAEPWTGGCPVSALPTRALTTFADVWRAPVGRVYWAGSELARHWNGYMEGALESAERVASEVLARLS